MGGHFDATGTGNWHDDDDQPINGCTCIDVSDILATRRGWPARYLVRLLASRYAGADVPRRIAWESAGWANASDEAKQRADDDVVAISMVDGADRVTATFVRIHDKWVPTEDTPGIPGAPRFTTAAGPGRSLVGTAEVAGRAGVAQATVHAWRSRHGNFPEPVAQLATGSVWVWEDIEAWLAKPRPTGRPRKS